MIDTEIECIVSFNGVEKVDFQNDAAQDTLFTGVSMSNFISSYKAIFDMRKYDLTVAATLAYVQALPVRNAPEARYVHIRSISTN